MAEALGVVSSVIAVVELSAKLGSVCLQYSKDVKNAKQDIEKVAGEIQNGKAVAEQVNDLIHSPHGEKLKASQQLASGIDEHCTELKKLERKLQPSTARQTMRRFGISALKWPFEKKDVEDILQRLARSRQIISLALQADQTALIQNTDHVVQSVDRKYDLDKLPMARGAAFDAYAEDESHSRACLPDTRVQLLGEIHGWIDSRDAKPIFWLNGMAGTGKSTVARTVARRRAQKDRDLAASFFFKRGETDRASLVKLVPTLARQLVSRHPGLASVVQVAIDADPAIADKALRTQFAQLLQPLLARLADAGAASPLAPLVVVLDALDECGGDVPLLIQLFSQAGAALPRLRVFVTSRPELAVRLGFDPLQGEYQHVVLHDIPTSIVEHDLRAFFQHELCAIAHNFNQTVGLERRLAPDWPGDAALARLVDMAMPLFIAAATVCRFVNDRQRGNPGKQLLAILEQPRRGSKLDLTYGPVLGAQLSDGAEDEWEEIVGNFNQVVGTIVTLANPLSVSGLSRLLGVAPASVADRLDHFHSVLDVPSTPDAPVRLLHLSFRDYLVDPRRKQDRFWVDETARHAELAASSLRVMGIGLQENICNMAFPGMRRSALDKGQVDAVLTTELQYACLYWVHHCVATAVNTEVVSAVYDFLREHFLHWLEAMSLMDRMAESIYGLRAMVGWLTEGECQDLLRDAIRFVQANLILIKDTPLQVYSSALVFSPNKSIVRQLFEKCIPSWLSGWPRTQKQWDSCLSVLESHSGWVNSVVFSHDGKLVATASDDKTARIWSVETGACVLELAGHSHRVNSVVFSHDGKLVATASVDKTARIWSVETGACVSELAGHSHWVNSVVFSHDGKLVATASSDKTARIWSVETGACVSELAGHSHRVNSVVFSHDGKLVATASVDKTARIWSVETGACVSELAGHCDSVNSVVFSHDGKLVATASVDKTARMWSVETGKSTHSTSCSRFLWFTADNCALVTDTRVVPIADRRTTPHMEPALPPRVSRPQIGLKDTTWITVGGKEFLWLPVECRDGSVAMLNGTAVIGCDGGRVVLVSIDTNSV